MLDDFGRLGRSYRETDEEKADLEIVIADLMSGQYSNPVRVVAFNTAKRWAEDASGDIAREIMRRFDLAGDEVPSSLEGFIERHLGPKRQLTLRLAYWVFRVVSLFGLCRDTPRTWQDIICGPAVLAV